MVRTALILCVAALCAGVASAQVNLKNGNYAVGYVDVAGAELEVSRTYNSKSTFEGMFGYGWGWRYETRLFPLADGSIVFREHGGGGATRFEPAFHDPDALAYSVDQIVDARVRDGDLRTPEEVAESRAELHDNAERRFYWWAHLVESGDLAPFDPPAGTEWAGSERGFQRVQRTGNGYVRTSNGSTEIFDEVGRLVSIDDEDGRRTLGYDEDGLAWIESEIGERISFELDSLGRVVRAEMEQQHATYEYDAANNLVDHRNAGGERFRYEYDEKHNLTKIAYEDGSFMTITYDPDSNFTLRVQDRNGDATRYEYEYGRRPDGSKDENIYLTRVHRTGLDGSEVVDTYTWEILTTESGRRYTYRTVTEIHGIRTETIYNECCGLPISIRRGDQETTFEYDARGNLIRKASEDELLLNTYDLDFNKVVRVERWTPDEEELVEWHAFTYDDSGNLARAENSAGEWVELTYDAEERIERMELSGGWMTFSYNEQGKPARMTLDDGAQVLVTYDEYGEIESVKSEDGAAASVAVMQRFQTLTSLVKPSGMNLNL